MQDFVSLVDGLNIASKIRGMSTNVANYQPIGISAWALAASCRARLRPSAAHRPSPLPAVCPTFDWCLNNAHPGDPCCADPCNLASQYNPSVNEHNYVLQLSKAFAPV